MSARSYDVKASPIMFLRGAWQPYNAMLNETPRAAVFYINADHSPFFSRPHELLACLSRLGAIHASSRGVDRL